MREHDHEHHHYHHHDGPDGGSTMSRGAEWGGRGGPGRRGGRTDDGPGRPRRGRGPFGPTPWGPTPWDGPNGPEDDALHAELRHLHRAVRGLVHTGTGTQRAQAQQLLAETRRHIYGLLAEEPTAEAGPTPAQVTGEAG